LHFLFTPRILFLCLFYITGKNRSRNIILQLIKYFYKYPVSIKLTFVKISIFFGTNTHKKNFTDFLDIEKRNIKGKIHD